jgi:hypothetical protein
MGDRARTAKTVILRYNRVPFSTTLDGTHEFLLREGREQVEKIQGGGRNMYKIMHEYR